MRSSPALRLRRAPINMWLYFANGPDGDLCCDLHATRLELLSKPCSRLIRCRDERSVVLSADSKPWVSRKWFNAGDSDERPDEEARGDWLLREPLFFRKRMVIAKRFSFRETSFAQNAQ